MFCGVLIVYSVIVIPWRIGFDVDSEGPFEVFDVGVDLMFALDMCLCFATGIYVEERLVTDLPAIRNQYLSTWFLPDLLSTVPIDKVAGAFLGGGGGGATTYASDFVFRNASQLVEDDIAGGALASLGLIRILRLARLLKLMRLLKLSKKASGVDVNDLINPAIRKLLSVLGKIIFIAHLLSCMWFGVNECEPIKKLWPSSAELVVWDQATEVRECYRERPRPPRCCGPRHPPALTLLSPLPPSPPPAHRPPCTTSRTGACAGTTRCSRSTSPPSTGPSRR
jgi:hypothetical protein